MSLTHGLKFEESRFWVIHRRHRYGPFDYQWTQDFLGLEMLYQGEKFGEYCSREEFFADLKPFRLPSRVSQAVSVVMGCLIRVMLDGYPVGERVQIALDRLNSLGLGQFAEVEE